MMLQCCIDAKRRRHKLVESTTTNYTVDNDEYFDANEDIDDDDDDDDSIKTVEMSDVDNVDRLPIGRLHPFENVKLLNRPDDAVYVPITQVSCNIMVVDYF